MDTILAFDLGTGGVKAALFPAQGFPCLGEAFLEYPTVNTLGLPGVFEQRPDNWMDAVTASARAVIGQSGVSGDSVRAVALSGHSLGVVAIDRQGKLLSEVTPLWSDTRAEKEAEAFFTRVDEGEWYARTGNGFPRATYPIFKMMWYKRCAPLLYRDAVCFLGSKDYINYRLTGVTATDPSYASGSGAFDLEKGGYIPEYFEAAGIDRSKLPDIVPSGEVLGRVTGDMARRLGISDQAVVIAGAVDNACMALGARCYREGDSYLSLGTSSWIAAACRRPVIDQKCKPYTFAHCLPGVAVSATCIFAAGTALRWLRDTLGGVLSYDDLTLEAALSPPGAHGVMFNPSLSGGSLLEPSPLIRGAFLGLETRHTRADLTRAVLEGVAMNLKIARDVLAACTPLNPTLRIVGGGARSPLWRQIFADVFSCEVRVDQVTQLAAAAGAAACAATSLGYWDDLSPLDKLGGEESVARPDPDAARFYARWLDAFKKTAPHVDAVSKILRTEENIHGSV